MVDRSGSPEKITGFHGVHHDSLATEEWPEKKGGRVGRFLFMTFIIVLFTAFALFILYFRFPEMWDAFFHAKWYRYILAGFSMWMYSRGESFFS